MASGLLLMACGQWSSTSSVPLPRSYYLLKWFLVLDDLTEEQVKTARELGEARKKFLKIKAKELGLSAQKLEKSIGKALKKLNAGAKKKEAKQQTSKEKKPATKAPSVFLIY